MDGNQQVERILVQKCDKVDIDREELLAKHIEYAERSETPLTDEEMRTFLEPKIDDAVDLVDRATLRIEELRAGDETIVANAANERKLLEHTTMRLHGESCERLVDEIVNEINLITSKVAATVSDNNKVKSALIELDKAEEDLNKSWNDRKMMITATVLFLWKDKKHCE